jgi:TPR repeat protein
VDKFSALVGLIIQNDYGFSMDDNSGKKFSLQDWVMNRAANQPGDVAAVLRSELGKGEERPEEDAGEENSAAPSEESLRAIERLERLERRAEMRMRQQRAAATSSRAEEKSEEEEDIAQKMSELSAAVERESALPRVRAASSSSAVSSSSVPTAAAVATLASVVPAAVSSAASSAAPGAGSLQQLQIVRLLQDLGDRLRQSERERGVLWKEVEMFKKLLAEMEEKNGRTDKFCKSLEEQVAQRDTRIQELTSHQAELEQTQKQQATSVEEVKQGQHKVEEKISSLETTAGSAIVRIEDALSESDKLSKKLEQIGQDKARLLRKVETMEEALTQTQDTLKAKALVLLTDQALAARTGLPQTPAWGAAPQPHVAAIASSADTAPSSSPLQGIKDSLRAAPMGRLGWALLLGAVAALAVGSGIALGRYQVLPPQKISPDSKISENPALADGQDTGVSSQPVSQNQDALMGQIAQLANQIEPSALPEETSTQERKSAAEEAGQEIDLEEKVAVEAFMAEKPEENISMRIRRDQGLPKAIREIEQRAFGGDAASQHDLAAIYTAGQAGVKTNYTRAAEWFREAAYQKVANAQYNLGVLYHQGLGVKQDTKEALRLYRVAAANDHAEAAYNLGIAYIEGVGVTYNPHSAAAYFERAAAGGVAEAGYNLGLIYENGLLGGEAQPDEALFWYRLSAKAENKSAKEALSSLMKQLGMTEDDALRLVKRMAVRKPGFFDPKTGEVIALKPEKISQQAAEPTAAPAAVVKTKISPPAAPKKEMAAKAADPVIVAQVQEQLIRLGLYPGPADGVVNEMTRDAVRFYQESSGITVDGLPGEDVLVHMLAAEMDISPVER